jgi:ABC-type uncharacterized transport system substrate-binding protein
MKRREFITLLGGAAAWPHATLAQQASLPVVGFISAGSPGQHIMAALRQGLAEAGYVDGRNVTIEAHLAEGRYDRLPMMVAELVRRQVAVIVAGPTPAALGGRDERCDGQEIEVSFATFVRNRAEALLIGTDSFFYSRRVYAGRILKGEKPADMPVQAPTKYELVVILKTAKALGLSIPQSLLATSDEVIE